jgi:hypothetical protein
MFLFFSLLLLLLLIDRCGAKVWDLDLSGETNWFSTDWSCRNPQDGGRQCTMPSLSNNEWDFTSCTRNSGGCTPYLE